jgi:hypothetical protein
MFQKIVDAAVGSFGVLQPANLPFSDAYIRPVATPWRIFPNRSRSSTDRMVIKKSKATQHRMDSGCDLNVALPPSIESNVPFENQT